MSEENGAVASSEKANNNNPAAKVAEYNPLWKGYVFIGLSSLVNFTSIANINRDDRFNYWSASMAFGIITFVLALLVLIQDRSQRCIESFHYSKAKDGYFEGGTLLFSVLWWIVGTGYTTHVGGIGYAALDIYFSSWLALASCIYTLNEWSAAKDILSISELTGLSATLKSWWVLHLSSLVVLGTCIELQVRLGGDELDDTVFGIGMALVSSIISFLFILVHYDFIPQCEEGGWLELSSSFLLILLWIIALAVMTHDQGIAATISGSKCSRDDLSLRFSNCSITIYEELSDGTVVQYHQMCTDLPRQVPGSNLFIAAWICFVASLNISFRWKAQQALQFAQAQQEKHQRRLARGYDAEAQNQSTGEEDDEDDEEDEEDEKDQ